MILWMEGQDFEYEYSSPFNGDNFSNITQSKYASEESDNTHNTFTACCKALSFMLQICFASIGVPINCITIYHTWRRYKTVSHPAVHMVAHTCINISDILLLTVYASNQPLAWLRIRNTLVNSDAMCRFVAVVQTFAFSLNGNILSVIAIDRYNGARRPLSGIAFSNDMVPVLMVVAVLLAVVTSLPAAACHALFEFGQLKQCVDIWTFADMTPLDMSQFLEPFGTATRTNLIDEHTYRTYTAFFMVIFPTSVMVACYALTLRILFTRHIVSRVKGDNVSRGPSVLNSLHLRMSTRRHKPPMLSATDTKYHSHGHVNDVTISPSMPPRTMSDSMGMRVAAGIGRVRRINKRAINSTLTVIVVRIFCWMPYYVALIWLIVTQSAYRSNIELLNALLHFSMITCVIDPLIYGQMSVSTLIKMVVPQRLQRKLSLNLSSPSDMRLNVSYRLGDNASITASRRTNTMDERNMLHVPCENT